MLASERTRYIISQLHSKGIINLKDIAKELNISEATVRRDFEKLENEGKLTRVTGGAKLNEHGEEAPVINSAELTMRAKKNLNYDAKLRVARRACDYIGPQSKSPAANPYRTATSSSQPSAHNQYDWWDCCARETPN